MGHISFFGLGAVNLLFFLTAKSLAASSPLNIAANLLIVGAITMPICCAVMAHFQKMYLIFAVPVVSLIVGGFLTLMEVAKL